LVQGKCKTREGKAGVPKGRVMSDNIHETKGQARERKAGGVELKWAINTRNGQEERASAIFMTGKEKKNLRKIWWGKKNKGCTGANLCQRGSQIITRLMGAQK